jgi:hypothetical protein
MIDRTHERPVIRHCRILSLARSTAYYRPQDANAADLALMRRIDELHLEHPFAGSRMLRDKLKREGHKLGRKHVATLMKKMGIEALYKKPNTSRRHPAHPAPQPSPLHAACNRCCELVAFHTPQSDYLNFQFRNRFVIGSPFSNHRIYIRKAPLNEVKFVSNQTGPPLRSHKYRMAGQLLARYHAIDHL